MKNLIGGMLAVFLLSAATSSFAWFGNNWGNHGWNPYDVWDPRYWMNEMDDAFNNDDDYWGGPWGGYGPYGPGYGYGPGYYGTPYGGYGGYPGYGYGPYGY